MMVTLRLTSGVRQLPPFATAPVVCRQARLNFALTVRSWPFALLPIAEVTVCLPALSSHFVPHSNRRKIEETVDFLTDTTQVARDRAVS